jgi:NADH dehydrogenase FAD-containing subunit/uncharacterized membrane protein YphA (DoxX/SURF4 family)
MNRWMSRLVAVHTLLFRVVDKALWPFVDLALRVWLSHTFFISGMMKMMSPLTDASVTAAIEMGGSALLAVGLLTRPVAILMGVLAVVAPEYRSLDVHLYWVALFGWYAIMGPGPLSMDTLLHRGLADSALPGAARVTTAEAWMTSRLGPFYQWALRLWVAAAIAAASLATGANELTRDRVPHRLFEWLLPLDAAPALPEAGGLIVAILLVFGLATRPLALVVILGGCTVAMMHMLSQHAAVHLNWLVPLMLLVLHGAGRLSLDSLIVKLLAERFPQLADKAPFALDSVPRVVVVGAGFGGLACAVALGRARVCVTIIDRANYHLFQPLLYQVATAGLSPGDIATPIRTLFRNCFNTRVLLGEVTGIDSVNHRVLLGERFVPYDYLVLATGATHSYFGNDHWQTHAPGLKKIEDATQIRRRMLTAFERAEATEDDEERQSLLTFLVVGGGPTGVELSGAIAELARFGMEKDFRRFDPASARVVLVQSGPRVLPAFPEVLSSRAQQALERLGVDVLTDSRVEDIDADGVIVSGRRIRASTVLWAAGVVASPAARWLNVPADSAGRAKVGEDLSAPGNANVFVIGDTSLAFAWNGQPVPGLAPAAKQAGAYAAGVIRARVEGRAPAGPFVYRHRGSLATIGRKAAVAHFVRVKLSGATAWWLWGLVHIGFLVGIRNRFATMLNWFWAYLSWGGGIRLITGEAGSGSGQSRATGA